MQEACTVRDGFRKGKKRLQKQASAGHSPCGKDTAANIYLSICLEFEQLIAFARHGIPE
jgi:hypothetical protein